MSHYRQGYEFECAVRTKLISDGYEVLRSAGSKTKIDLVGLKKGELLFIQCKVNGVCSPSERKGIMGLAGMVGAVPIVALKERDGRRVRIAYRRLIGFGPREWIVWTSEWGTQ